MKTRLLIGWLAVTLSVHGQVIVTLSSLNDGNDGRDRYGFSYGWENSGFNAVSGTIWVGHWYESSWASGSQRTGYLQVPLAGLPDASLVSATTLHLYIESFDNASDPAANLSQVNAATANGLASQKLASTVGTAQPISPNGAGWYAFDFTPGVTADLQSGYTHSAFIVSQLSYRGLTFRSADYADPVYRPYLAVTAIPEPATAVWLMGVAALLGAALRRRR